MIVQNIYSCGKWLRIRRILEDQARLATERKLSRAMCQNPKTSLSASGNNSHVRDQVVYLENAENWALVEVVMAEKWQFVFILWLEGYDKTPAGTVRETVLYWCGSQTPKI